MSSVSPVEQEIAQVRRACSRNYTRLCSWTFFSFRLASSEEKQQQRQQLDLPLDPRPATRVELNDKWTRSHSAILGARWRARDYSAVRSWWSATRSVARRLSSMSSPKTRTRRWEAVYIRSTRTHEWWLQHKVREVRRNHTARPSLPSRPTFTPKLQNQLGADRYTHWGQIHFCTFISFWWSPLLPRADRLQIRPDAVAPDTDSFRNVIRLSFNF